MTGNCTRKHGNRLIKMQIILEICITRGPYTKFYSILSKGRTISRPVFILAAISSYLHLLFKLFF